MAPTEQTRVLLDMLAALGGPGIETMSPDEARAMMAAFPRGTGPEVGAVTDVIAPGADGADIPVRVYRPAGEGPFPVLCYFHGGGWVLGSVDESDATSRRLCDLAGCLVVSPDYRLAPEHPFPTAAEDCYAVTTWAEAEIGAHGGDPTRLAVSGGSAGGNLAAVVALMARDRDGPALCFQFLEYPVIAADLGTGSYRENADGYLLTRATMAWFWDHYVPDPTRRTDPLVAPLHADDLAGLPPALVITAELDPLRDEGEAYGAALEAAGVPTTVTRYDGVVHGFFGMHGMIDEADTAQREAAAALRVAFGVD
jgi:acetyl esterase